MQNKSRVLFNADVDPLAGAASGWKPPEYPVLAADRLCQFEITQCTKEPLNEDKGKPEAEQRQMLVLVLTTTQDYPDKNGKPLRKGFKGYHRIGLYEMTGNPDKRDRTFKGQIGPDLAICLQCCGKNNASPRDLINDPSMIKGCIVDMKTRINAAKNGFAESNGFSFVPPS